MRPSTFNCCSLGYDVSGTQTAISVRTAHWNLYGIIEWDLEREKKTLQFMENIFEMNIFISENWFKYIYKAILLNSLWEFSCEFACLWVSVCMRARKTQWTLYKFVEYTRIQQKINSHICLNKLIKCDCGAIQSIFDSSWTFHFFYIVYRNISCIFLSTSGPIERSKPTRLKFIISPFR